MIVAQARPATAATQSDDDATTATTSTTTPTATTPTAPAAATTTAAAATASVASTSATATTNGSSAESADDWHDSATVSATAAAWLSDRHAAHAHELCESASQLSKQYNADEAAVHDGGRWQAYVTAAPASARPTRQPVSAGSCSLAQSAAIYCALAAAEP